MKKMLLIITVMLFASNVFAKEISFYVPFINYSGNYNQKTAIAVAINKTKKHENYNKIYKLSYEYVKITYDNINNGTLSAIGINYGFSNNNPIYYIDITTGLKYYNCEKIIQENSYAININSTVGYMLKGKKYNLKTNESLLLFLSTGYNHSIDTKYNLNNIDFNDLSLSSIYISIGFKLCY